MNMMTTVANYFSSLQTEICSALDRQDEGSHFSATEYRSETGLGRPRVLEQGKVIEKAAVNFSHNRGDSLPPAASSRVASLAPAPATRTS